MRILIVCARFPDAQGKGDQQRSLQLARLLAEHQHDVRVIAAARPASEAQRTTVAQVATVVPLRVGVPYRAAGAIVGLFAGRPLQVGWMMPARAHAAVAHAAAESDAVIVVTIRCLRGPLPAPTVLDHIDALSANMRQRATLERRLPLRAAARAEAWLLARHERRAARWVIAQLVVSPLDAHALPQEPRPVVLPLVLDLPGGSAQPPPGCDGSREPDGARDVDLIFTGDMRYPPNRDAAEWLACEIVPALRATHPGARVIIAGRGAAKLGQAPDIELLSDVPDLARLLRRARVAAVPLRSGTGTPIKVHEAAAGGAAVVSTPWVAEATGANIDTASDASGFAAAIAALLDDEALRLRRVADLRASLLGSSSESVWQVLDVVLARVKVL